MATVVPVQYTPGNTTTRGGKLQGAAHLAQGVVDIMKGLQEHKKQQESQARTDAIAGSLKEYGVPEALSRTLTPEDAAVLLQRLTEKREKAAADAAAAEAERLRIEGQEEAVFSVFPDVPNPDESVGGPGNALEVVRIMRQRQRDRAANRPNVPLSPEEFEGYAAFLREQGASDAALNMYSKAPAGIVEQHLGKYIEAAIDEYDEERDAKQDEKDADALYIARGWDEFVGRGDSLAVAQANIEGIEKRAHDLNMANMNFEHNLDAQNRRFMHDADMANRGYIHDRKLARFKEGLERETTSIQEAKEVQRVRQSTRALIDAVGVPSQDLTDEEVDILEPVMAEHTTLFRENDSALFKKELEDFDMSGEIQQTLFSESKFNQLTDEFFGHALGADLQIYQETGQPRILHASLSHAKRSRRMALDALKMLNTIVSQAPDTFAVMTDETMQKLAQYMIVKRGFRISTERLLTYLDAMRVDSRSFQNGR